MNAEEKRNPGGGTRELEDELLEEVSGGTLSELFQRANEQVNGRFSKNSTGSTGEAPKQ